MATSYTYSIQDDITNQDVNIKQLETEILEDSLTPVLIGVTSESGNVIIDFDSALSSGEKTTLDTTIQNHVAIVDEVFRKLYRPKDTYLISPSGGDFETIKEAVDTVSAGSLLLLYPGTYVETNPLTLRYNTVLRGMGLPLTVTIVGTVATQPIMILENQTILEGVHLTGASGTGGCGVYVDSSIGFGRAMITRTIVSNCETGFKSEFVSQVSGLPPCTMMCLETMVTATATTTLTTGYHSVDGSMIRCIDTGATGNLTQTVGTGYSSTGVHPVTGESSVLRINSGGIQYCNVALYCDNGGELESHANRIEHSTTGCLIGTNGTTSKMGVHGIVFNDISGNHIETTNTDCIIYATGGRLRHDKISIPYPNNITYDVFYFSDEPSNTALQVNGVLSVGDNMDGTKAYFGSGYSHIYSVITMTNTNGEVGTWNDLSTDLLNDNAVLSPLFAGSGAEQCLYIGDDVPFSAVYIQFTTALSGGAVAIEFWNGSIWDSVHVQCKQYEPPYTSYADDCFSNVAKVDIYLGILSSWTTKTLNSLNKYWIRFRITTTITTIPVSCHIRLYNDASAFERDGYMIQVGNARTQQLITLSLNDFHVTSGSPTSQDVFLYDTLKVAIANNRFPSTGTTGIGQILHIPYDMDTSCKMELCLNWFASDDTTGDVVWQIAYGKTSTQFYLTSGEAPASSAQTQNKTINVPTSSKGSIVVTEFDVFLSDATQDDCIVVSLQRLGDDGADTYAGDTVIHCIDLKYYKNCLGNHFTL